MTGSNMIAQSQKARTFCTTNESADTSRLRSNAPCTATPVPRNRILMTGSNLHRAPLSWQRHGSMFDCPARTKYLTVDFCRGHERLWNLSGNTSRKKSGVTRCSSDGVASLDVMMPDGASEDYPILLEEADASDGEWTRRKRHAKRLQKLESTIERVRYVLLDLSYLSR